MIVMVLVLLQALLFQHLQCNLVGSGLLLSHLQWELPVLALALALALAAR